RDDRPDDPPVEEERERRRQALRHLRVRDEDLEPEREQRVPPRRRLVLRAGEQSLLRELARERDDVLLVAVAAQLLAEQRRELGRRALAVDVLEQRIHERPELDHLAV